LVIYDLRGGSPDPPRKSAAQTRRQPAIRAAVQENRRAQ